MHYSYTGRGLTGNPLANALTIVLGVIALVAAVLFGFVLLTAFLIAGAVFVSFVALRIWWLKRRLTGAAGARVRRSECGNSERPAQRPGQRPGRTITHAEYTVIDDDDSDTREI